MYLKSIRSLLQIWLFLYGHMLGGFRFCPLDFYHKNNFQEKQYTDTLVGLEKLLAQKYNSDLLETYMSKNLVVLCT